MKRIIIACTLALLIPFNLLADGENQTARYLAPNGVDQGDCSQRTNPCASVKYVLGRTAKADPVYMAGGEYEIQAEQVVHFTGDKVPLIPGYSTRDLYNTQALNLNPVTLIGVPSYFRDELSTKGFRIISDRKGMSDSQKLAMKNFTEEFKKTSRQNNVATPCVNGTAGNFPCNNVDLLSQLSLNNMSSNPSSGSDIWGHVDLNNNREYAIMGLRNGTIVVDVTDAENPVEVGTINGVSSTWRDIKVYQYNDAGTYKAYAYVTTEGPQGLQIIDLNNLPGSIALANTITEFTTAHNVYISNVDYSTNTALDGMDAFIYIVGSNRNSGAYRVFDLTNPLAPNLVTSPPSGTGYVHDATSVVITDERTSQCAAGHNPCEVYIDYNENTVDLWDMTDKSNPTELSSTPYSGSRYTHSGWFSDDKRYVYIQDELDEQQTGTNTRVIILDINNLSSPTIVGSYLGPTRAIDHNGFTLGDLYYMSNYHRGLTILDVSNPTDPVEAGFFDTFTSGNNASFDGAWGTYPYLPSGNILISDINSGLFVVKYSNAGNLQPQTPAEFPEDISEIVVTVNRESGTSGAVSVDYATADDTASAGEDYTASTGTLNWADGENTAKTITIEILDDDIAEALETFTLNFSNVQGDASISNPSVNLTIEASDQPGLVGFSTTDITADEDAGTLTVNIERANGSTGSVSVDYQTVDGTATSGADFTATSGTLSWADNEAGTKSFTLELLDDTDAESNETFSIALLNPQNGITLDNSTTTVTINANDARGSLGFTSSDQAVAEDVQSVTLMVERIGGDTGEVSLTYATVSESATAGSDFTEASGTLTWADGDTTAQSISIEINNDSDQEEAENFSVELSNATNQAILGSSEVTITIEANDGRGALGFTSTNQTVAEDVSEVVLMVERTGGDIGEVSLTYATVANTATAGSDFTETNGTLTWADGDASAKSINIAINNDDTEESDESFSVELTDPTNQATLGSSNVTITIAANDTPAPVTPPQPEPEPISSNGGGSIGWGLLVLMFGLRLKRSMIRK